MKLLFLFMVAVLVCVAWPGVFPALIVFGVTLAISAITALAFIEVNLWFLR